MEQSLIIVQLITTIITTLATVATLIVVIIYTKYTARMTSAAKESADAAKQTISEMKETREQENAPYVVVYFDIPIDKHLVYLVIKNVGKSIAEDIKMKFIPNLSSVVVDTINDISLIKDGIRSLPPNYEIRTLFDGVMQRFGNSNLPLTYMVEVSYSYSGFTKKREKNIQTLDLSVYHNTIPLHGKGMDDLVKTIEELAKHTKEIKSNLKEISESLTRGIWIRNPVLTVAENSLCLDSWHDGLIAKLKEFQLLWLATYGKKDTKFIDPFLPDLQNKAILISEQIIIILSTSPFSVPKQLTDDLCTIAHKLSDLGTKRFYIDGGKSASEFDALGEETFKIIENTTKEIYSMRTSLLNNEEDFD